MFYSNATRLRRRANQIILTLNLEVDEMSQFKINILNIW